MRALKNATWHLTKCLTTIENNLHLPNFLESVRPATRSVADAKCGCGVLAFLGLVISLICLLLERIYRPFLINTQCNLFYDFAACIPVLMNKKHKIEHNKFAVFDDVHIVSGSYNWTTNASKNNSENCLFFNQPNKEYSHRFEYLWNLYK